MRRGWRRWLRLVARHALCGLALWLAVAVPIACHHAAPRALFFAQSHQHHALDDVGVGALADGAAHDGQAGAAHRARAAPTVVDWLTIPCAALPAPSLAGLPLVHERVLLALAWPPPSTALPLHDPPPRLLLATRI